MGNWTANYVIYENHVNKHIGIHKNGCSQIGKNGGNGIGKYIGFSNFDDAYEYAKNSNLPIKDCSFCIKNIQNKYSCEENIMENKTPNTKDFEEALSFIFKYKTICENADYVEIQSDKLHEFVGGYPAKDGNHRMPICCAAMRKFITENDEILNDSPSGQSSKLLIRYKIPRNL